MFFRINLIWSDMEADTYYFYAISLRKVIDHLIHKKLIPMSHDELENMSDENLYYKFIKNNIKSINIKILDSVNVTNLENGLTHKTKLQIPRQSVQETPFKNFIVKKRA